VTDSGAESGGSTGGGGAGQQVARADVPRNVASAANPADLAALAEGNTAFAFDLYRAVAAQQDGNFLFSPYSMSLALAMVYAGARGETEAQMGQTLHYTLPQDRLHATFNALDLALTGLTQPTPEGGEDEESGDLRLHIANAVWGQQGYDFLPAYLDLLAANYGAGLRLLDFAAGPDAARQAINGWVSDQTEERIQDLLPPNSVGPDTRLVLVNAIYFYGAWADQFDEASTQDDPFTLLDGGQVTVPMMAQGGLSLPYMAGDGFTAVELPYGTGQAAMLVILPDAGRFAEVEAALDAARLAEIRQGLSSAAIGTLKMPRFEFESTLDLKDLLVGMGLTLPFEDAADFSGITDPTSLRIDAAVHKANITVDENGTEAAAATAVVMVEAAAMIPDQTVDVILDRPFIFAILDRSTGTVLFLGRVLNPAAN